MAISISILGASGKMGQRVLHMAKQNPEFQIAGLFLRRKQDPFLEQKENAPVFYTLKETIDACDVVIDFSSALATVEHLEVAIQKKKPVVLGTTGLSNAEKEALEKASRQIPILFSANFSFGIALCMEVALSIKKGLGKSCKIDIFETHHIHKKDAPSGTAYAFAEKLSPGQVVIASPDLKERSHGEILIHSKREGEVIGEHTIVFDCCQEKIELKHTATSRDAFAQGALVAAKFIVKQPPGLYTLKDLFQV